MTNFMNALAAIRTADAIRMGIVFSIGLFYFLAAMRSRRDGCVGCLVFPIGGCMSLITFTIVALLATTTSAFLSGMCMFLIIVFGLWPVVWRVLFRAYR
ncbi:MAG: hypothetical protein KC546_09150, partial [Anaerolineae bacterium]|nr:hypothetical protein [Anaerolineae bacterium]